MKKPIKNYLKDYRPADFIIDYVDLTFDIDDEKTIVTSVLKIRKDPSIADKTTPLVFDKGDFKITHVVANGMVLLPGEYESGDDFFKLNQTPDKFELEITSVLEPHKNTTLEGLYKSGNIFCTQCEAQGFRKITPFLDRPDVMAIYSCTIIADKDKYPVLLSNGNLLDSGVLEDNRHYARWVDPFKKPSYLFALVAGDLAHISDDFTTRSGRVIDLKIYSEKENIGQCDHAMKSLKQSMKWDEERFGLEYDLDLFQIVAINDFNAGAMENKGLNIFNSKYVLADPKSATDDDFMNIQGVIGHEYFHNWTGNRVTLKNWFQLSLKEGLTVFRDQEFSSDLNSRGVKRISCVRNLRAFQFPEDAGPMTHPVRPESYIKMDNFYTMTVYEKGAELVRMIHLLIGENLFQKGMTLYFDKYDGMAVTIEDFVGIMQEASGIDLAQFKRWYVQSGTPIVNVKREYNPTDQTLTLTFSQHTKPDRNNKIKLPFHIPVGFGIIDKDGKDITPDGKKLLELKKEKQTFLFDNIPKHSLPSVFRQFSAPIKITTDLSNEDLAFLMAHDTDDFNRWDAAQTLFFNELTTLVTCFQKNKKPEVTKHIADAFKKALTDPKIDRAFLAKMLSLPLETEIKDHFDSIDVTAIHDARIFLEKSLAKQLKNELLIIVKACSNADPSSISHNAMADRSLKNLCLSYLGSLKEPDTTQLIKQHFDSAKNMTDEMAAFKILCEINLETKNQAVQYFFSKWQHDKLVLDKWFAVQAASMLPDTLDQVKSLCDHADFSMTNPNKVRSLIYMFALHNPILFHREDGKGYGFIADKIIELDSINHMVAARLSLCFNHWKRYDEKRKALMKKELERILCIQSLSKNVYEIVSRALE
ncbi:MAG: aminopeptidase N [Pseudomonadota bacterium]